MKKVSRTKAAAGTIKNTGRAVARAKNAVTGKFVASRKTTGSSPTPDRRERKPEPDVKTYPPPAFIGLFKDDHDLAVRAKDIARGRE